MTQTTEITFSFRVPGCGIASALSGLAIAAQIEKLLSDNGCALQLGHIYPYQTNPVGLVTGETADAAEADKTPEPETPAPAEATPAPEPDKPKRTRTPKAETPPAAKEPEAPAPQPEPEKQPETPQAAATPAPDPANGIVCCEKLAGIHRTGRSAAAAAFMPQWNAVTEAIVAAGYNSVAAIRAALGEPKTAAQAAADVTAILSKCEKSLAELEATIAAKKAKADEDGLD